MIYSRTLALTLAFCCVLTLSACQSGWVRLDGSVAQSDELQRARTACEVDQKLMALEASRGTGSTAAEGVTSNQARMLRIENFEVESARVYAEIDACMQRQGLRKP